MERYEWMCPSLLANGSVCGFAIIAYTEEGLKLRQEMHVHAMHVQKALPGEVLDYSVIKWTPNDLILLRLAKIKP